MEEASACGISVSLSLGVVPEVPFPNTQGSRGEECKAYAGITVRMEEGGDYRDRRYGRSCAHDRGDTAADGCVRTHGDIEGQDGYQTFQEISGIEGASLLGEQILEPRILREHGRDGRTEDTSLREVSGRQRKKGRGRPEGLWPL